MREMTERHSGSPKPCAPYVVYRHVLDGAYIYRLREGTPQVCLSINRVSIMSYLSHGLKESIART